MQKTAVSTPSKGKRQNYFKYEMKDTNQLLKNFFSCAVTDALSPSDKNKQQIDIQDMFRQSLCMRKLQKAVDFEQLKKLPQKKPNESYQISRFDPKDGTKYKDELQNDEDQFLKDFIYESSLVGKRKKHNQNTIEDLILQKFYVDASQNNEEEETINKPAIQKYRNREVEVWGGEKYEQMRQGNSGGSSKKQKKGLANISLRVKNIVSQHKRLTYKQVSDYVLQYSRQEIQSLQPSQRIKQVKNIKRRVYDALNVLVAVGILGKHQRCVCYTQWTNIPGKRHATEWNRVNGKIQQLNRLKKNCSDKAQALNVLVSKYNAVAALRNKHLQEQRQEQALRKQLRRLQINNNSNTNTKQQPTQPQPLLLTKKLMFPVILFCPAFDQDPSDKLTVEFQQGDNQNQLNNNQSQQQMKRKVKISGKNITILGDFDCALEMDLQKYRDGEEETKLMQEIEDYANECTRHKMAHEKHELVDFADGSIDDYFNEQMFTSK